MKTKKTIKTHKKPKYTPKWDGSYCRVCGGCGFIGCDGIKTFLEKHVRGKTNCDNEELFIEDIIASINL